MYDPVSADGFNPVAIYAPLEVLQRITKRYNRGIVLYLRTALQGAVFTAQERAGVKDLLDDQGIQDRRRHDAGPGSRGNQLSFRHLVSMIGGRPVVVVMVGGITHMAPLPSRPRTKQNRALREVGVRSGIVPGIIVGGVSRSAHWAGGCANLEPYQSPAGLSTGHGKGWGNS